MVLISSVSSSLDGYFDCDKFSFISFISFSIADCEMRSWDCWFMTAAWLLATVSNFSPDDLTLSSSARMDPSRLIFSVAMSAENFA